MSRHIRKRYLAQFKDDAVRLVEEEGYSVVEVSQRLGVERSCIKTRTRRYASCARRCAAAAVRGRKLISSM